MMYVNGYKTKRCTTQKKNININVYQTNSPPKLVITKTFFPLTWSSPPKSITPLRNDIQFSNFSPFLTRLSKGIKRKRKRIRNHRLTRKRKTRCYGHKDNQNYTKHVKKNACKRISIDREIARQVSSIIDIDRCSCWGSIEGQNNKRLKRSRSIHQVSRSYRGDRIFLDRSTRCREAV